MTSPSLRKVALLVLVVVPHLMSLPPTSQSDDLREINYHGRPALVLSNDVIELTVLERGGALVGLVLKDDPQKTNPFWDAFRADREASQLPRQNGMVGHFICVDGFGPASRQEQAAGMPSYHGEAHSLTWVTQSLEKRGQTAILVQKVYLPRVQEVLIRTLKLADGENVIHVRSTVKNLLSFDRPLCWAEHVTIGSPFLEPGVTVVDLSSNRAVTRAHEERLLRPHRLAPDREFSWPMAPTVDGSMVDLRKTPKPPNSYDWTGYLWDRNREFAFVTALHPAKGLLLGYVFRRSEYPWMQMWEHYPPQGVLARGLEFGTQVFGRPRRDVITQNKLFGQLLYRWLPAKSQIEASFLLFWTRTTEGFQGVDEIQLREGTLYITDRRSGIMLTLRLSQPF